MNIGEKIKTLRIERDWQQKDLAQRLNVAQNTISQYELNTREPSMEMLERLAGVFNVPISHFVDNKNKSPETESNTVIYTKAEHDSFAIMLIDRLLKEGIIKDPDNIPQETFDMIMSALKMDIKRVQEEKKNNK